MKSYEKEETISLVNEENKSYRNYICNIYIYIYIYNIYNRIFNRI